MPTSPSLRRRFGSFAVAVALLALQLTPAIAAEITTDVWVYQYGDTVTVTGVDYAPDETVELVTTDPNAVEFDRGTAQTDLYGGFTYAFVLTSDVPGIYDVVATGQSSGLSATTQFDPNNFSTTYGQAPDPVQYSDVTTLSGQVTCSHTGGGPTCPADLSSSVLVELNPGGGFFTIGTAPAGSSGVWSTTWQVNVLPAVVAYASRATASGGVLPAPPPAVSANDTFTIRKEDTTTAYGGAGGGSEFTSLALSGTVADADLSKFLPDSNLVGTNVVSFQLRNSTDTANVGSAVTANISNLGATTGSPSLVLPAAGSYKLRTTYSGNGYYLGSSDLDTIVVAGSNTGPSVSVTGVTDGSSYAKGSVPVAGCSVTDTEDGPSTFPATQSAISGADAAHGIGSQTASCSYTDAGGLTDTDSATYTITDGTAPSISYVLTPSAPDGDNSWFVSNVSLVWTVDEGDSPSTLTVIGCVDQSLSADQASTDYPCSATSAGGSAGPVTVSIKIDKSAPVITDTFATTSPNGAGWYKTDVINGFSLNADISGPDAACALAFPGNAQTKTTSGEGLAVTVTSDGCTDNAGNAAVGVTSGSFKIDKSAPVITDTFATTSPNGAGWYKTDVINGFSLNADISGPDAACALAFPGNAQTKTTSGEGLAVTVTSDGCTDNAGNAAVGVTSGSFKIDKSAPTAVSFVGGGITEGGNYYFGFVPAGPSSCTADYEISGSAGCIVSGGGLTVGPHTYDAAATDQAGNVGHRTLHYTVLAWTISGFFQPVDMGGVYNTVKNGSTVPLKFRIFAGSVEITDTSDLAVTYTWIPCNTSAPVDAVEEIVTTGGTVLRYDTTGHQFIDNWKTPSGSVIGNCYQVTMKSLDGSHIDAFFKLK